MVNLENISASRWDKLLDDTFLNGEVEGKKLELVICSSAHWLKLRCIKIYCHFLGKYCNGYKKILEKNFRWRKCLVLMAENFSSYPLPDTAKEWIIPLIKQSKPPPLFWVFMFVFQVTIDQYQACQCGWYS